MIVICDHVISIFVYPDMTIFSEHMGFRMGIMFIDSYMRMHFT